MRTVADPQARLSRIPGGWRLSHDGTTEDFHGPLLVKVGRRWVALMANPDSTPERWRYQIRRAEEQKARIERKLRLYAGSLAEKAYRARLADIENDLVNWRAALWAAGEPDDRDAPRGSAIISDGKT